MNKEQTQPLLSIIIPTYNRAALLVYTLSFFKEQIERNADKVDLIVCDNASTDETDSVMQEFSKNEDFFTYKHYAQHLELGGDSIVRSTENAEGKFFLIYGDDDIPMPYMVDYLLYCIKRFPDIGYMCFNRLRGNSFEEGFGIENIHIGGQNHICEGIVEYKNVGDFAEKHQSEVGFISVNVIRTDLWNKRYKDVYPNDCRGYEFILPYLYSAKGQRCIYVQHPLCIQRLPSLINKNAAQLWGDKRLLYFYLGRPRAIFAQEKYGIVKDGKILFKLYEKQFGPKFLLSQLLNVAEASSEVFDCVDEMITYLSDEREIKMVKRLLSNKKFKRNLYVRAYKIKIKIEQKVRSFKHFFALK